LNILSVSIIIYLKWLNCPCAEHHAMKKYCGSGGIASRILDLGTKLRWVATLPPVKEPLVPIG